MQAKLPETELALRETLRATFNASGIASTTLQVGPNQRWQITLMNTNTTSTTQTQVTVYRGSVGGARLDFSRTGNDDTSNTDVALGQGDTLAVQWTGGTSGAIAQLNVEGVKFLKGRRAYGV